MARDSDHSDFESESSSESDQDYDIPASTSAGASRPGPSVKMGKRPARIRVHKIPEIAHVTSTATDSVDDATDAEERLAAVDQAVLSKIRKSLNLAQHEATGEAEAKAALKMASILMKRINITQADLIAPEDATEKAKRAGQSTVSITVNPECKTRGKGHKPKAVQIKSWQRTGVWAIQEFFDVKSYSTRYVANEAKGRKPSVEWVFYGIAENTTAAAYAFEMIHNTIMTWSHEQANLKGRVALNSYRTGVASGLYHAAKGEKKAEEQRVIEHERKLIAERVKQEEEDRERELQRLRGPSVKQEPAEPERSQTVKVEEDVCVKQEPVYQGVKLEEVADEEYGRYNPPDEMDEDRRFDRGGFGSDSDNDALDVDFNVAPDFNNDDDDNMDLDAAFPRVKSEEPAAVKKEESPPAEQWRSMGQLTRFRKDAETIADDYIKSKELKLRKGRKRAANQIDSKAYRQGKEDSKKIDVKRRRLEGGTKSEH